ncbi:hydrolase CocE/NonD family protein [Streptomyces sp. 150FB]|uniref:CocE/NonD family hydrolase n=1 Tax=Streptomyces sp. 150FB TaxID=1576605 RepID=UPI0005892757|nr:CocE/NonD family hydrolase [Streptomyces sp. 150FB]KIF75087.1 hydrolase CocE/NonD family protein [Streptomyces sp. 150FB]
MSRTVRVLRHQWIHLADGTRLSARVWLPESALTEPAPAVLEYIPYRKNDATAARDNSLHARFAQAGYVAVRVDSRGTGDSDGLMLDEYAPIELADGVEVIEWLAGQPWCDGGVGMIGKSWGGFNGLQIAALRPPALKAVVTVCSTDDRYADDVHYTGGSLIASEMLPWASTMLAYNARPADPDVVGDGWREQWLGRLADTPAYVEEWLAHQTRDAYWKHGSVCEDYASIQAPVLAVGGWSDPYCGAVLRLLEGLEAPVRALVGPWAHTYPHQAEPGPAIDFHAEVVRWFDQWMRGVDTGAEDDPALRAWMPEWAAPGTDREIRPGRWVAEEQWPSRRIEEWVVPLTGPLADPQPGPLPAPLADPQPGPLPDSLSESIHASPPDPFSASLPDSLPAPLDSTRVIGLAGGSWLQFGDAAGQPGPQGGDDGLSHTFTTAPLTVRKEILGAPSVALRVSADRPAAQLAVRLTDVAPDGSSRLITRGLLNLTHREGHETPLPLEPGRAYDVTVPLPATAHAFAPGHRIRVAVSSSYWPLAWPSPEPVTVTLLPGGPCELRLPVRPERAEDAALRPYGPPLPDLPAQLSQSRGATGRRIEQDPVSGTSVVTLSVDDGHFTDLSDGSWRRTDAVDRFTLTEGDPLSALVECERVEELGRGDWRTKVVTYSRMTCDATSFAVSNTVTAYEGDTRVFHRTTDCAIPRRGV